MSCRNCKWLGVTLSENGKLKISKRYTYPCKAPVTEMPKFPESVLRAVGFYWPPSRTFVGPEDGGTWQIFIERTDDDLCAKEGA